MKAGFHFFSSGSGWEDAFHGAARFLQETEGSLILGPGVGNSGALWLLDKNLEQNPLQLGARVVEWKEWVKGRARSEALGRGQAFQLFNEASRREFVRGILLDLEKIEALKQLPALWREERFFSALLDCVDEARLAGLCEPEALERAREMLSSGADPVTREAYDDFWHLLLGFERWRQAEDFSSLLRRATGDGEVAFERDLFLLGFDHFHLQEVDLLQSIARQRVVHIPLALSAAEILSVARGSGELSVDTMAAQALRSLVTGFPGEVQLSDPSPDQEVPPRYHLSGHAPSEEIRAAACFAHHCLAEGRKVRLVAPRDAFDEYGGILREELGLPESFASRSVLANPVARLFFHALKVKESRYDLAHCLEFAQLLQFTRKRFPRVPALAHRAGIRRGLLDWKRKSAGEPELEEFTAVLEELEDLLPSKAPAIAFARALAQVAELAGIGELARRAADREIEREAHGALAAMIRHGQMLAASLKGDLTFAEWLAEWSSLLQKAQLPEGAQFFPRLQFFHYSDWLPPAEDDTVTILLRWDGGILPRRSFQFFLEEGARRKLGDLGFSTQVQEELTFFDRIRRMAQGGMVLFSWSRHEANGKEVEPPWFASSLPLTSMPWPEVARDLQAKPFQARRDVLVPSPALEHFSASLLESYKECPFKAYALRVLGLEDKIQAASLDVGPMELGRILHRTLELYYGEHKGKDKIPSEREPLLDQCLELAAAEQPVAYFKGSPELMQAQLESLRRTLVDFLHQDGENYQQFPYFRDPDVEQEVSGQLGPYRWKGKIDRIDVDETNKTFMVVDYKMGSTPKSADVKGLELFQLPLYLQAAQALHPDKEPIGGLYLGLKSGERNQGMVRSSFNRTAKDKEGPHYYQFRSNVGALLNDEDFDRLREESLKEALRLADEVQAGKFPVSPLHEEESCKRCEVRPACRIRQLQAPASLAWPRVEPDFTPLFSPPKVVERSSGPGKGFNEEQTQALEKTDGLVFVEASAGTGKTTVIVEKIRRFLAGRLAAGDAPHRAVERFAAISFTDKSAQELGARVSKSLLDGTGVEPGMGPRLAAQAVRQISTIHGFCRRILSDFPVEAGISPMARLMDERETERMREEAVEEFFLQPPEDARESMGALFLQFSRAKIEGFLRKLLSQRLLLQRDLSIYQEWLDGKRELPGDLVIPGAEKDTFSHLLRLSDSFQAAFARLKKEKQALDFNDLEELSLKVLAHEHVQAYYRERFQLLLVDEFQDTNSVQREILERVAQPGWKNLFVVGDAKQSIYRFRAADVSVFQSLRGEAEQGGNLVSLFRNYRSRRELVETANQVTAAIFPAPGQEAPSFEAVGSAAEAVRSSGGRLAVVEYDEEEDFTAADRRRKEASLVVEEVLRQLARGREPGSIAILLRKISGNEAFLQALTHAGIPFRVGSSKGFYSQPVVTDGIALLRYLYGNQNEMALLSLLRSPWVALPEEKIMALSRGKFLSDALQEKDAPLLFRWRERATFRSFSELLFEAYRHYPLDRRAHLQTVKLLSILRGLERDGLARAQTLELLSLWAGWEKEEDALDDATMPEPGTGGAVQVMTVHSAKGLEFDLTLLPDLNSVTQADRSALRMVSGVGVALKLEEDKKALAYTEVGEKDRERDLAESKRLLYVALTRAKEECVIFLPRAGEKKEGSRRRDSWADLLRGSGVKSLGVEGALEARPTARAEGRPAAEGRLQDSLARRVETSITELAALQLCPEFHRRKYVQGWDDLVVGLWDKPAGAYRKKKRPPELDAERGQAMSLLKELGLEKKERGIALHRVLERVNSFDRDRAALWLGEAYAAQGADSANPLLQDLIALDLKLLERFLTSSVGRDLFAPDLEVYPEVPFQWRVGTDILHGAMDRLIRRPDGLWVVVDYKSSILEESLERYRFQVASYMAAIHAYALSRGEKNPRIEGVLVDLYASESHPVERGLDEADRFLRAEIRRLEKNYTLAEEELDLSSRKIEAGPHCFSCPYAEHCDVGSKFVLAFK